MARFGSLGTQYFDNSGQPLSGGKITFYNSGLDTLKNTYSDINLTTANTNPVILDASGRQPNVFFAGVAKAVLSTSSNTIIETRDPVGDDNFDAAFADWNASFSYSEGNIVTYTDGNYYASLVDDNIGNDPSASPSEWDLLIDVLLGVQQLIQPGYIGVGGTSGGIISLNTKTKGTLSVGNGTTTTTVAVGTDGYVLTADSTDPEGLKWAEIPDTARDYQAFTTSGTWTKPANAGFVLVEAWGAGGGGAANTSAGNAGGGSGGEYVSQIFLASTLGATETVTIGAGGAGGAAASSNAGATGGNTTFGAFLTALGGNPGLATATCATAPRAREPSQPEVTANDSLLYIPAITAGYGGAGSGGVGGQSLYGGGGGGGGAQAGGASQFGGSGGAGTNTLNTAGTAGSAPAGGGGGSSTSNVSGGGGAGARGEIRVWTW